MRYKVLITPRSFGVGCSRPGNILLEGNCEITTNPYNRVLTEQDLSQVIKDFDGIIVGLERVTRHVITAADKLKVISKHGTGVNNVDLEAASEKNIMVTNTPGVNAHSVADLTIGMIISIARQIPRNNEYAKKREENRIIGKDIHGKVLGIVGLGKIGKEVVRRAQGFGMKILYTDLYPTKELERKYKISFVDLKTLLKHSDFVSLHLPLTPQTENLIGKEELNLMGKGSYVINTSRAAIIDEDALYQVLKNGEIAGAAVDVYRKGSLLLNLNNVICLPHIGAYTYETIKKMGIISAKNVVRVLHGQTPLFKVN